MVHTVYTSPAARVPVVFSVTPSVTDVLLLFSAERDVGEFTLSVPRLNLDPLLLLEPR